MMIKLFKFLSSKSQVEMIKRGLIIPPGATEKPTKTVTDLLEDFTRSVLGPENRHGSNNMGREHLYKYLPATQAELPVRKMSDSYDTAIIPLGTDMSMREKYMTFHKTIRIGRLLEDLDIFAVTLCYRHILNPKQPSNVSISPYSIVTACVDQIDISHVPLRHDADIRLRGHVTWVGKSSLEATMEVDQIDEKTNAWNTVTNARFVMVSRDPMNKGSAIVNQLLPETEGEKALFRKGEENKERRTQMQTTSLFRKPPSEQERLIIHDQFLRTIDWKSMSFKTRIKPANSVWMADAKLKNMIICHPENRNRFNKIFGGFLMRLAVELAWANCYVYCKSLPTVVHVDDILFRKPVEIGSLLYFSSQVVYTQGHYVMVRVSAEVVQPEDGTHDLTNVFHFTLKTDGMAPEVIPRTYQEAMMFLDGRRHFMDTEHPSPAGGPLAKL
ncbi:acyl-coenzyme A thioesterase 9, mitochondrial isoform X1 [Daphnia magna]|uniref:acyl-coenzyme A thioesterase 9, mitochondrial isoform X1 n=2 Tax=Daphnia magna TaxID=35525 RepID=UPI0006DF941D|nr:acyl-coenzyme A thioesterase 9, mitochondrial isoform X1 [Daphnia magna]